MSSAGRPSDTMRWQRAMASASMPKTIRQVLGLAESADHEQIRAEYIRAALAKHPDVCRLPNAAAEFAELQRAWERHMVEFPASSPRAPSAGDIGSFSDFGVGCSFSDTPEEQAERAALVEQAARGVMNSRRLTDGG